MGQGPAERLRRTWIAETGTNRYRKSWLASFGPLLGRLAFRNYANFEKQQQTNRRFVRIASE